MQEVAIVEGMKKKEKDFIIDYLTPFAKIVIVDEESPASKAGLKVGDLLSEFAKVNIYTMDNIKEIPKYVKEGVPVVLITLRMTQDEADEKTIFRLKDGNNYQKIKCEITPSKWIGKGLIGCKIDPLQ